MQTLRFQVRTEHQVDYVQPDPMHEVYIYKSTTSEYIDGKFDRQIINEGISNTKPVPNIPDVTCDQNLVLASSELLDHVRLNGFTFCQQIFDIDYEKPFTNFTSPNKNDYKLVVFRFDLRMVFDLDAQPLPVVVRCNYIDGRFDNAHYDLKKAVEILNSRKDIFDTPVKIKEIPCPYNSSFRNKYIEFRWAPSLEDYRKMWQRCLELSKPEHETIWNPKYKAIWDLDLLGLRSAALFDDYYKSTESNEK